MKPILKRRLTIQANADIVYQLLTDAARLVEWLAVEAECEAHPGGIVRWRHANGDVCLGRFTELVPGKRVVFSYGWERADVGIPPGSTTVEIDLTEQDGATLLELTHHGLSAPAAEAHAVGWQHYLARLCARAAGADPGPDSLAEQRVPSFV
ncbi:MAG: SRPBCC family protein [Chloroflexota bacterium]